MRRFLHAAVLLLGVSLFSFLLGRLAPGSFFDDLKMNPQISAGNIARLEARYGIGRPAEERYAAWLASAARGDFGTSLTYQRPVAEIVWPRARNTLSLTSAATVFTWLLALPLGMLTAWRPYGVLDRFVSAISAVFLAIPELILALVLLAFGLLSPVAVLVAGGFPLVFSHVRAAVLEAECAPFVTAARAHGIRGARLWLRYILLAAANPLLSLFGLWIGGLIGGSLLVEWIAGRPGLGPLFLDAVSSRDLDVVTAVMLLSAAFLIAGNLLADVLLAMLDPRVRRSEA